MKGRGFDYVNRTYGVPAKQGMRIRVDGRPGSITSSNGQYIYVRFDGWKSTMPCHPTWRTEYLDEAGEVLFRGEGWPAPAPSVAAATGGAQ